MSWCSPSATRAHVGNRIYYYYLHFVFAHIKENIVTNGHPLAGCDTVLEKGNHDAKKHKRTVYWGGSDVAENRTLKVTKYRVTVGANGETTKQSSTFSRENAHGSSYQMLGLQILSEHIAAEKRARLIQVKSEAQTECARVKRESDLAMRDSNVAGLEMVQSNL